MRLAVLAVLLGSAPAVAAPCSVTVTQAPDRVREEVEHWVGAEPRCSAALEVRIVDVAGGLDIVARDDRGRVRDRVVPDAQTAGVLIASWVADDSVPAWAPVMPAETTAVATVPSVGPAGPAAEASERRWIRLGFTDGVAAAMLSPDLAVSHTLTSVGLRGSAGVWTRGAWTLDASLDAVASRPVIVGRPAGDLEIHAYTASANLGYALRSGPVSLTPSVGLGAGYTTFFYSVADRPHTFHESGLMCEARASALGAIDFNGRWQLTVGMTATFHADPWTIRENMELVWIGGMGWAM